MLSMVTHSCHPSYTTSINRRITVQDMLGIKVRGPYGFSAEEELTPTLLKLFLCPSLLPA
jgi:hypothetical protein